MSSIDLISVLALDSVFERALRAFFSLLAGSFDEYETRSGLGLSSFFFLPWPSSSDSNFPFPSAGISLNGPFAPTASLSFSPLS